VAGTHSRPAQMKARSFGSSLCLRSSGRPSESWSFAPHREDGVVAQLQDCWQLVGDDTIVVPANVAQRRIRSSSPARAERVEAADGSSKYRISVEGDRTLPAGPLAQCRADLGRVVVLEARQAHERELERGEGTGIGDASRRARERQADVLSSVIELKRAAPW